MNITGVLLYLGLWGFAGCFFFSLFVIVVFRTGFVWKARNKEGLLKKKLPAGSIAGMLLIPAAILGLQVCADYFGFKEGIFSSSTLPGSGWSLNKVLYLFLFNFHLYLLLFAYDTIVVDYLVLVKWRPRFLKIPNTLTDESMKKHIKYSIPVGIGVGIVLSLISTAVSYFIVQEF